MLKAYIIIAIFEAKIGEETAVTKLLADAIEISRLEDTFLEDRLHRDRNITQY